MCVAVFYALWANGRYCPNQSSEDVLVPLLKHESPGVCHHIREFLETNEAKQPVGELLEKYGKWNIS